MREIWKPIDGWKQYEVSNLGRVRRLPGKTSNGHNWKGGILRPSPKGDAGVYLHDGKRHRMEKVCRLVLFAFRGPPPPGMESCHWDDNKQNNVLSNLRWDTHKANAHDALRNKLMVCKLTPNDIRNIRLEYDPKTTSKRGCKNMKGSILYMAKKYNVTRNAITNIVRRKVWKHVD